NAGKLTAARAPGPDFLVSRVQCRLRTGRSGLVDGRLPHFMPGEVTQLLSELAGGDGGAVERILPIVYQDLHALAATFLHDERRGHTLQPTALVHEAFLRLVNQRSTDWKDRTHFFAIASQAMRRVLVDHARTRGRAKRGGGRIRALVEADMVFAQDPAADILALDDALPRLGSVHAQARRILEMRRF